MGEAAKEVPTRTDHKAQPYPAVSPTSTKPLVQQQLEDKKKLENAQ